MPILTPPVNVGDNPCTSFPSPFVHAQMDEDDALSLQCQCIIQKLINCSYLYWDSQCWAAHEDHCFVFHYQLWSPGGFGSDGKGWNTLCCPYCPGAPVWHGCPVPPYGGGLTGVPHPEHSLCCPSAGHSETTKRKRLEFYVHTHVKVVWEAFWSAHLALALADLKWTVLIAPHHYRVIRRHTSSAGQFAVTITEGIPSICRHYMMWCRGRFRASHKSNVNGGVWWGRGAAVKHGDIVKGSSVLFIEAFHPWGIWRKKEFLKGISQSRAGLTLTGIFRSE